MSFENSIPFDFEQSKWVLEIVKFIDKIDLHEHRLDKEHALQRVTPSQVVALQLFEAALHSIKERQVDLQAVTVGRIDLRSEIDFGQKDRVQHEQIGLGVANGVRLKIKALQIINVCPKYFDCTRFQLLCLHREQAQVLVQDGETIEDLFERQIGGDLIQIMAGELIWRKENKFEKFNFHKSKLDQTKTPTFSYSSI